MTLFLVGVPIAANEESVERTKASLDVELGRLFWPTASELGEPGIHVQMRVEADTEPAAARRAVYWIGRCARRAGLFWREPDIDTVVVEHADA